MNSYPFQALRTVLTPKYNRPKTPKRTAKWKIENSPITVTATANSNADENDK